jgi:UDP-N-acetylglucosamine--dolichyl-phosphate N-acetylglucosaminephosphotransferase
MGAVSAFVYIFIMFCFIPFPYYKYLVTETSGAGNRDVEETVAPNFLENGRTLHLFPHNKVNHISCINPNNSLANISLLS